MPAKKPPAKQKTRGKTPSKTPSRAVSVAKRPQPQGGYLQTGNPGNTGGPGRPPDELRELSRGAYGSLIGELRRRVDAKLIEAAELSELASLLGVTGRFGLGEKSELTITSPDVVT